MCMGRFTPWLFSGLILVSPLRVPGSQLAPLTEAPVISAPPYVTSAQAGYQASVPLRSGLTYSWTLTNGALTSPSAGETVIFTAGESGMTHLTCTATDADGVTSPPGTATSIIVPAPAISSFSAAPAVITSGQATLLSWAADGGLQLNLDPGFGDVTDRTTQHTAPLTTTLFTLTATNLAGTSAKSTALVTVVPEPSISSLTATPDVIDPGDHSTLAFAFADGTGVIDPSVGTVRSGETREVAPATTTTYTLTVTNPAGAILSQSVTVTVVTPSLPSLSKGTP